MTRTLHYLVAATLLLAGCGGGGGDPVITPEPTAPIDTSYTYVIPEDTGDGLMTASLVDVGMSVETMEALVDEVTDGNYRNIHGMLVAKDSMLVFEKYFAGTDSSGDFKGFYRDTLHGQHSVTKSFNSALIGIALGQGLISDVDARVVDLLPQHADLFTSPAKMELTLRDFLTMNAGYEWDEWTYPYDDPRNDHSIMDAQPNQIRYVLDLPLASEPGTSFTYNSGVSIALGGIVANVSGSDVAPFAVENLFRPLGITDFFWYRYPNSGIVATGGGLWLRPRDMTKFGLLYLNGGRWGNEQIVPEWWVEAAMVKQAVDNSASWDYSYQWWMSTFSVNGQDIQQISAQGRGGQYIFVIPSLNLVAVFTGWNDNQLAFQPTDMMRRFVLPAAM